MSARIRFAAAVLAAAGLVATTTAGAHAAASPLPSNSTKKITFFSDHPMPAGKVKATSLPAAAQAQVAGTVTPATSTPGGYLLRRGGLLSDYVYKSADVYAIEASCDFWGDCTSIQQVKLGLREAVQGGSSTLWTMTLYATSWSGPSWFGLDYYYVCGVNIAGDDDKTCDTWAADGADGPVDSPAGNNTAFTKSFGYRSATKFPMVNMKVEFNDGSQARGDDGQIGEKFRGWDVCVIGTDNHMCPATGDGT